MSGDVTRLHWADYVVTALCLLVALFIGVFFAVFKGGQKTREEYLVGNRRMGLLPVCASLFVTYQSAISLIGTPADAYNTGTMVGYIFVGICLSDLVGYFTVVPLVYPLKLTSVFHYMQLRFESHRVRLLITAIAMLQTTFYMAVSLYTPAMILQAVAGLSLWVSLFLVGGVGTVYTAIGGIKSVVWTDVFQTVIVFIGILAVLIKGLMSVGGVSQMGKIAASGGRLIFAEVDPRERHSLWSTIIGGCFMYMVLHFNQSSVQRICSMSSLKDAGRCYLLNVPLHFLYGSTLTLMGVLMYAYFVTVGCDPYAAGFIHNKNQVGPYFVLHVLREMPGMSGLYMSMLFSGALSTFSSGINSLAANTVEDVLVRPLKRYSDITVTVIAKVTVVGFGCLTMGLAYLMKNLKGPVTQLGTVAISSFGSPVLGVFFLAAAFPRCNTYGAGGGIVVGSAVSLLLSLGCNLHGSYRHSLPSGPTDRCDVTNTSWTPRNDSVTSADGIVNATAVAAVPDFQRSSDFSLWDISYLWGPVIGCCATVLSGLVISFIEGLIKDQDPVDPKFIFPFCRKLYGLSLLEAKDEDQVDNVPLKENHTSTKGKKEEADSSSFLTDGIDHLSIAAYLNRVRI